MIPIPNNFSLAMSTPSESDGAVGAHYYSPVTFGGGKNALTVPPVLIIGAVAVAALYIWKR